MQNFAWAVMCPARRSPPAAHWIQGVAELRRQIARLRPCLVHAWLPTAEPSWRLISLARPRVPWLVSQSGFMPAHVWWQAHAERRRLTGIRAWSVSHPGAVALALVSGIPCRGHSPDRGGSRAARRTGEAQGSMARVPRPAQRSADCRSGRTLNVRGGWKDLIWAADMLKFIRDDVHLLISGTGPLEQRLQRFRRQVRIEDKVHMLPARQNLTDWLAHCDVFCSGRSDNGQPLELLMAMAAGVPSIATQLAGAEQVIRHGHSGYLVPVGDRAGIARLTRKLLDQPELAQTLGQQGREQVLASFSARQMGESFLSVYRGLTN